MARHLQIILNLTLACSLIGYQKTPIPPYRGDDNPQHDGQPMYCRNYETSQEAPNCACKAMAAPGKECPEDENAGDEPTKCAVYCRKTACQCERRCGG